MRAASLSVILIVALLPALTACEAELSEVPAPANHPPIIRSAAITPNPVTLAEPVKVEIEAHDPDQDPLTFRAQWYGDDRLLTTQESTILEPSLLRRGMRIRAEIIASDGRLESRPYATPAVVVANAPPRIVSLEPEAPIRMGQPIRLKVDGVDPDGDSVDYTYRWWRNSELLEGMDRPELETAGFARGDIIQVEVTPHDGQSSGLPVVAQLAIENTPPAITSTPSMTVEQGMYQYAVRAEDPDGDALSYALEQAPEGMTIDGTTGRISWRLSEGISGRHHVKVLVEDGQNGQAYQEFDLVVPTATAPAPDTDARPEVAPAS